VTGAFLGVFIPTGSGGLTDPHYLFFHTDGRLYVTAFGNNKVVRFDAATGAFLDAFVIDDAGTPEDESGGLVSAHGAAFGPDGDLYVASFGNNRVLRYNGVTGDFVSVVVAPQAGVVGPIDVLFVTGPCPGDVDANGIIDFADLLEVLTQWGPCAECAADLDGSGTVDFADLVALLSAWGACSA
jgi:DNA-binding beta-propeller fold protein YncE